MESRKFVITIISASDLEDVRKIFKMEVHARVFVGQVGEKRTRTDKHGKTNPSWNLNSTMEYDVSESVVKDYNTMLVVKLYCKRMLGDRYVGEVYISMKELFDTSRATVMRLPVRRGCKKSQGELRFSYRFGEKEMIDKYLLNETDFVKEPSGEGPTKGKGKSFPWKKVIKSVIKGIIYIVITNDGYSPL